MPICKDIQNTKIISKCIRSYMHREWLFLFEFLTYIPHNASQLPPIPACTTWWAWHWSSPAQVSETIPNAACDLELSRLCCTRTASVVFLRWDKDWLALGHCESENGCVVVAIRSAQLASHAGNTGVRIAPGAWYGWKKKTRYFRHNVHVSMTCKIFFQVHSLDVINAVFRRLDSFPSCG